MQQIEMPQAKRQVSQGHGQKNRGKFITYCIIAAITGASIYALGYFVTVSVTYLGAVVGGL